MGQNIKEAFESKLRERLGNMLSLRWETDRRGVVCGWCDIEAEDISVTAEIVKSFNGRVMTITSLITSGNTETEHVEVKYHFYFEGVNLTVSVNLQDAFKKVKSITPILKSADWHEREMQELYNIKILNHPNPKKLFLDSSIEWTDKTMIPLSEAMNGASTSTLWEKVMESKSGEADTDE